MKHKVYRKYNVGKLLAIHENNDQFVDCYGSVRPCSWGAEFEDCIVPISPDDGKVLARMIGDEVTAISPSLIREMMQPKDGLPYVNEASGTILGIEESNVLVVVFEDCRIGVPWSIGSKLEVGDNVRIMRVKWTNDMQAMYDAMFGMSMAACATGRMKVADGYEQVLDWLRSVKFYHVVVEKL